eukprot:TRINITY_DN13021_c0_g1_i1.p1 TRINITY_DN13021_c0_g1~~TRINITY_DN13021_c0_g1_i1.p1  ORF type:complete len:923 (+),score=172.02 TRINITY_DN13021_c0_g1_i1:97-2865(+)
MASSEVDVLRDALVDGIASALHAALSRDLCRSIDEILSKQFAGWSGPPSTGCVSSITSADAACHPPSCLAEAIVGLNGVAEDVESRSPRLPRKRGVSVSFREPDKNNCGSAEHMGGPQAVLATLPAVPSEALAAGAAAEGAAATEFVEATAAKSELLVSALPDVPPEDPDMMMEDGAKVPEDRTVGDVVFRPSGPVVSAVQWAEREDDALREVGSSQEAGEDGAATDLQPLLPASRPMVHRGQNGVPISYTVRKFVSDSGMATDLESTASGGNEGEEENDVVCKVKSKLRMNRVHSTPSTRSLSFTQEPTIISNLDAEQRWRRIGEKILASRMFCCTVLKDEWRLAFKVSRLSLTVREVERYQKVSLGPLRGMHGRRQELDERIRQQNTRQRHCLVQPYSIGRVFWDCIGLAVCIADIAIFPIFIAFALPEAISRFGQFFDLVVAVFWSMDICLTFCTGYQDEAALVEMRMTKVVWNYVTSWFPFDLGLVTIDWLSIFGLTSEVALASSAKRLIKLARGLRLLRLLKLGDTLKTVLGTSRSELIATLFGLLKLIMAIILLSHYLACCWYALGQHADGWPRHHLQSLEEDEWVYSYLTALHWSLTQFTPASMEVFPTTAGERFFNFVVIIFALVVFSSFVSSIQQAMSHLRRVRGNHILMESEVRSFFAENTISHETVCRVWRFLRRRDLCKKQRLAVQAVPAFKLLPQSIRDDLMVETYGPFLEVHPVFLMYRQMQTIGARSIYCDAVKEKHLLPDEDLFAKGAAIDCMFFVIVGMLEYVHGQYDLPEMFVKMGEWACEEAIWGQTPMLQGPFLALAEQNVLLTVDPNVIIREAKNSGPSCEFLVTYGDRFVDCFNRASMDPNSTELLFNDPAVLLSLAVEAAAACSMSVDMQTSPLRPWRSSWLAHPENCGLQSQGTVRFD